MLQSYDSSVTRINGLHPGTAYEVVWQLRDTTIESEILASATFRTTQTREQFEHHPYAETVCWLSSNEMNIAMRRNINPYHKPEQNAWSRLYDDGRDCDVTVVVGDAVYNDNIVANALDGRAAEEGIKRNYMENLFLHKDIAPALARGAHYFVADDHEIADCGLKYTDDRVFGTHRAAMLSAIRSIEKYEWGLRLDRHTMLLHVSPSVAIIENDIRYGFNLKQMNHTLHMASVRHAKTLLVAQNAPAFQLPEYIEAASDTCAFDQTLPSHKVSANAQVQMLLEWATSEFPKTKSTTKPKTGRFMAILAGNTRYALRQTISSFGFDVPVYYSSPVSQSLVPAIDKQKQSSASWTMHSMFSLFSATRVENVAVRMQPNVARVVFGEKLDEAPEVQFLCVEPVLQNAPAAARGCIQPSRLARFPGEEHDTMHSIRAIINAPLRYLQKLVSRL